MLLHLQHLLKLIVVDDVLISGTTLREGVQLIHMVHVAPEGGQFSGDVEIHEVLGGDANVLQAGHELAVETTHRVSG